MDISLETLTWKRGNEKGHGHGHGHGCRRGDGQWCSRSRRRAEKVDKRMVLVHTHGLFIT
jgi:hypothetical protein